MTKRLLRVLGGEAVWPPPIWLMRQAGRHLPEYRATRALAADFIDLVTRPELAAEATLQPVRRYGMDGAILFSDITMVPWALGQGLTVNEGEGPRLPPIRDAASLRRLEPGRVAGAIEPILQTVRRVRGELGDATLIGFAGGPFTVACYMIEGSGSKEFGHTRAMAYADPALFAAVMDRVTETTIEYLAAQIDAGAEAVMLFDSWAGLLSPDLFRAHVIAPTARIVASLKASHPDCPVIGFPRLAGSMLGEYAARTNLQAVAMDTGVDPAQAALVVPAAIALQGNLDPAALLAGGDALHAEAAGILALMRGRPFIFNLGHGVIPNTSPEHVAALVSQVRAA